MRSEEKVVWEQGSSGLLLINLLELSHIRGKVNVWAVVESLAHRVIIGSKLRVLTIKIHLVKGEEKVSYLHFICEGADRVCNKNLCESTLDNHLDSKRSGTEPIEDFMGKNSFANEEFLCEGLVSVFAVVKSGKILKHLFVRNHLDYFEDFKVLDEFIKKFLTNDDSKLLAISKLAMVFCLLNGKFHLCCVLFKRDNHLNLRSVNRLINIWICIFFHIFFHWRLILIPLDDWVNVISWTIFH